MLYVGILMVSNDGTSPGSEHEFLIRFRLSIIILINSTTEIRKGHFWARYVQYVRTIDTRRREIYAGGRIKLT